MPRQTRADRMRLPLARDVLKAVAIDHGVCVRPVSVRQTDRLTGEEQLIDLPCGATLAGKCPSCAERARRLRMHQCREGWHLDSEPALTPDVPSHSQRELVADRADVQRVRDLIADSGADTTDVDGLLDELDEEIAAAGMRGNLAPKDRPKRVRSTRRRDDAAELPRRRVAATTLGRTYGDEDGKRFRPSLFLTLTLDSYGRVRQDGTPVDPASYDYQRAARDALHFTKLVDRFVQNLRRYVGWDVQYFGAVEPQRRLAPHLHLAIRGTVSRAELRQVVAATYAQVWWPATGKPRYVERLPAWDADLAGYIDPETGEVLPTWAEALDQIGPAAEPAHVVRFGPVMDVQGVLAGTPDADRCIRYLAKYLTKSLADCHDPESDRQRAHTERLVAALRYEPCSPTCANWLRYGVQPKDARPNQRPGCCRGKAHRPEHLGYGGRRVLVSRKWTAKNLADHRADRRAYVLALLGQLPENDEPDRYEWQPVRSDDPAMPALGHRLMRAVAERFRWKAQLNAVRAMAEGRPPPVADLPATHPDAA
jgi:Replication initiator protein, pSAM2